MLFINMFPQQQQLHQPGMQGIHAHAPTIPLPHPGALPPQLPPGAASGILGISGQPPHLPVKDEKGRSPTLYCWIHFVWD